MIGFRRALWVAAAVVLGGCYYSWHGDARVQHNVSIISNGVDELRMGPVAVDRLGKRELQVRDLPGDICPYPSALWVMLESEATAQRKLPEEWKGVVLRLTFKTVEGKELWRGTCDLSAMREVAGYQRGREGKWEVYYQLRDMPEGLPHLRSYDVEIEVVKASAHAGDAVEVGY